MTDINKVLEHLKRLHTDERYFLFKLKAFENKLKKIKQEIKNTENKLKNSASKNGRSTKQ